LSRPCVDMKLTISAAPKMGQADLGRRTSAEMAESTRARTGICTVLSRMSPLSVPPFQTCRSRRHDQAMRGGVRSTDPVRLSFLASLLRDAGIEAVLLDMHASIADGSIGAIPRRLMVSVEDYTRACRVLQDAGES